MKKEILIETKEQKEEVFDLFNGFKSKNEIHKYFGISDNKQGTEYIKNIAVEIGFDLGIYKTRIMKSKKYCLNCGKEICNKWGEKFCSNACSASFNNKLRIKKNIVKKVIDSKKNETKKLDIKEIKTKRIKNVKYCLYCGKEVLSKSAKKFCSISCSVNHRHQESYNHFLENSNLYCNGGYTPYSFKKDILKEQDNKCIICGCEPIHNGKLLVFVLDHIDGDASNNKRDNLRMICPNCDSQLDTFKSKNKNSTRRNYWKEHIIKDLKK